MTKPSPGVAASILAQWGVGPLPPTLPATASATDVSTNGTTTTSSSIDDVAYWFVGDSPSDIRCGNAAGMLTCLIVDTPASEPLKSVFSDPESTPTVVVRSLEEFHQLLL